MYKKDLLNPCLAVLLLTLLQSEPAYAEQSVTPDKRSFKVKSDELAFSICVKDITKDPKAIKAVTGITTISSLCGCVKSEMNLLVDDQLAKNLGVAMNKTEKNISQSEEDKITISDWGAKYAASLGGCSNKALRESK